MGLAEFAHPLPKARKCALGLVGPPGRGLVECGPPLFQAGRNRLQRPFGATDRVAKDVEVGVAPPRPEQEANG